MEILLTKQCESYTGTIGRGFGYYIRSTKTGRFFSQRSKHQVPPDGHWRFIVTCAELAQMRFHIADIRVAIDEVTNALHEKGYHDYLWMFRYPETLCANDVLKLKIELGL